MRVDPKAAAQESLKLALAGMAIEVKDNADSLRPIGDQVLVRPDKPAEMSCGGIFIPQSAQKHTEFLRTGTVVAVGSGDMLPGGARGPMVSKVGDRVVYDQASNRVVRFGGEEFIIVREEQHLLCTL